jgi:hypothetical protein
MQGGVSSGVVTQSTKAYLLWVLLITRSLPRVCFSSSSSQRGPLALWLLVSGSPQTQKNHLWLNRSSSWFLAHVLLCVALTLATTRSLSHRDFSKPNALDGGPDNRQATHLRGEDVDLVGTLANVDFRDFRWHWWSECVDA